MQPYSSEISNNIKDAMSNVCLLALDVDGVLTQGEIHVLQNDANYMKSFNSLDGVGIYLLRQNNIDVVFITASKSMDIIQRRADDLRISKFVTGIIDKKSGLEQVLKELKLSPKQCAYMGDDIIDIAAMQYSGLGISVPNAHPFVRQHADYVTVNEGGRGAVREVCDIILKAHGLFEDIYASYLLK